uniref:Galectin domain-containing protein n=1 Tax=Panagrellus redivivus TaxID=6233 RepID=A0A7E4UVH1_PANRE
MSASGSVSPCSCSFVQAVRYADLTEKWTDNDTQSWCSCVAASSIMGVCMSRNVVDVRNSASGRPVVPYPGTQAVENGINGIAIGSGTNGNSVGENAPPAFIHGITKRESDMNILLPTDVQVYDSDESRFERERVMLVLCPNANPSKPAKLMLFDVNYQSKNYCQIISTLTLPTTDDEIMYAGWMRSASKFDDINVLHRTQLIVPCFDSSRIYIINVENQSTMKVNTCFEESQLISHNVQHPYNVCSWPGKHGPTLFSTCGDTSSRAKGDILLIKRDKLSITSRAEKNSNVYAVFGGFLALQPRHKIMITASLGDPSKLLDAFIDNNFDVKSCIQQHAYGSALNIWETDKIKLKQTIKLEDFGAFGFTCVRFIHNPECNHGFAVSAIGGSIFHIHKNSKTEDYHADKIVQYQSAKVSGWIKEEMPPLPLDIIISMDDRFLFVSCFLHGFVEQLNITDPFRVTTCSRVYLGGAIHRAFGVTLQRYNGINYTPKRFFVRGTEFHGGPARMQLSLDGRRLYVNNSFYTPWDSKLYPILITQGSAIALIHINVKPAGGLKLDENFLIQPGCQEFDDGPYLAREMKFMNGDSTSDHCLEN